MNTEQFITLQQEHDLATRNDSLSYEQTLYVNLFVKSKFPSLYQECVNEFKEIAPELYASGQQPANNSEDIF
jgi:hypothetical protein